jgi:CubicO group peptidase (beta-lactamase class C family)
MPGSAPDERELAAKLTELAERSNVPGAAVGVYHDGTEHYACYGVTSVEHPLPVDEHTRFQIGSTGKTFTSTALMRLLDRDELDLDAPVRRYLPEFRVADEDVAQRVTVLNLLNHTAGWDGDFFADTGPGDDALAKYVALMAELPQQSPLGGAASYNNAAVCLAGRVLEVLTGSTYERAVRELVIDPLGLADTGFHAEDTITHRFSVGHVNDGDTVRVARPWNFPRSGVPAGVGLVSSVRDQIRYGRFHLAGDPSVLSDSARSRMQEPTSTSQHGHYGISWDLREIDGVAVCAHGGTTFGQLSAFEFAPERAFAVTVLTNSTNGRELYEQLVDWARERYAGIRTPQPELLPLTPVQLQQYAGRYDRPEQYAEITVDGDRLLMVNRLTDLGRAELAKVLGDDAAWPDDEPPEPIGVLADDWFSFLGPRLSPVGRFLRDADGQVSSLDLGGRLAERAR